MGVSVSFIGAGRVAHGLAPLINWSGMQATMVAGRTPASARRLAGLAGCRMVSVNEAATADLVLLTVPDSAIGPVAARLAPVWRAGQAVVHCSGVTEVSVLQPATDAGAWIGGFHPLQSFADPEAARRHLAGSTVAIEAAELRLAAQLAALAQGLGMLVISLPPGARPLYHAGATLVSYGGAAALAPAVELWGGFGVAVEAAAKALLPLAGVAEKTLGPDGQPLVLGGPVARGDIETIRHHLVALAALGPEFAGHRQLYRRLVQGQLGLARRTAALADETIRAMEGLLEL